MQIAILHNNKLLHYFAITNETLHQSDTSHTVPKSTLKMQLVTLKKYKEFSRRKGYRHD